MKLETKFSPGETVWVINANRAITTEVESVSIFHKKGETRVSYMLVKLLCMEYSRFNQDEVFKTKQDLLDSL